MIDPSTKCKDALSFRIMVDDETHGTGMCGMSSIQIIIPAGTKYSDARQLLLGAAAEELARYGLDELLDEHFHQ